MEPNDTSTSDIATTKKTLVARLWYWLLDMHNKLVANVVRIASMTKQLAKDDPRKVVHSMKVGLALTLVSLFYYLQPFYDSFGDSATWAVVTVVVVFEFSVGATLGKGANRAMATLLAVGLAVGTYHLAFLCGKIGEAVLIGIFVFIFAAASTFTRFFPKIKARYDYGFLIFILTFSFISISGYRAEKNIIEMAHQRLSTIAIGAIVSLLINVLIYPVWAGEELHNSVVLNMEKLGHFLEVFGAVYLKAIDGETNSNDEIVTSLQGYKSVLNSKFSEESLANFASWEPRHGHFRYRHPWKQYIILGGLIRKCAYRVDALNAYFDGDNKLSHEVQEDIRVVFTKISLESSKSLKELGASLRAMTCPSSLVNSHIFNSKEAVASLKTIFKSTNTSLCNNQDSSKLLEIMPVLTVAFLLIDIVDYIEQIVAAACDLATLAHFRDFKVKESKVSPENNIDIDLPNKATLYQVSKDGCPHLVITVAELTVMTSSLVQEEVDAGCHHSMEE